MYKSFGKIVVTNSTSSFFLKLSYLCIILAVLSSIIKLVVCYYFDKFQLAFFLDDIHWEVYLVIFGCYFVFGLITIVADARKTDG